ncbi:hypothetical protein OOZ63_20755 [Paucibacter sp. PLA-PC-4]|nr:hypothetical protein [Paucibacter sp. PLA-PC-4]MCX2864263.1 hypothetical protein [Paucibacter sp. PLA-PC-4]
MNHLDRCDVFVHAAIVQIDDRDLQRYADVLQQGVGMQQLTRQRLPV